MTITFCFYRRKVVIGPCIGILSLLLILDEVTTVHSTYYLIVLYGSNRGEAILFVSLGTVTVWIDCNQLASDHFIIFQDRYTRFVRNYLAVDLIRLDHSDLRRPIYFLSLLGIDLFCSLTIFTQLPCYVLHIK
ncbi:unnamed protein product [Schistosoma rodhaini]|uniref:Uncharacterized protein n=1 Tax=Schistosoma rodhaini TaxID=6188 RepID=A0AA85EZL9_9TREM|nr:unnamed protein product [Schistosoma rodhaini]